MQSTALQEDVGSGPTNEQIYSHSLNQLRSYETQGSKGSREYHAYASSSGKEYGYRPGKGGEFGSKPKSCLGNAHWWGSA